MCTATRWLTLTLMIALAPADARAQLLDLDRPEMSESGSTPAADALAELLLAQADLHDRPGHVAGSPKGELRRLIAALLQTGRPIPILIGRTMASNLAELEALAASDRLDDVDRLLLVGDLRRARDPIPVSTDDLDRSLRDAMSRLAAARGDDPLGAGWSVGPMSDEATAPDLGRSLELVTTLADDPGARSACERLASMVQHARERPLYAPAGERLRDRFQRACAVLDDPPAWVSAEARIAGATGIAGACELMLDPPTRRVGADGLDRYAGLGRLIERCDKLGTTNDARALREDLASRLARPPALDAVEAVTRGLDIAIGDKAMQRDETELLRQLRPMWRSCVRAATLEARGIVPRLAPMLDVESPLTDPATLAVLASGAAPTVLARDLLTLSELLDDSPPASDAPPKAHGDRAKIADRVLSMAPGTDGAPGAETAATIRAMTRDLGRAAALAGAHPDTDPLSSPGAHALGAVLAAWADEQGDPAPARAAVERLERLATWQRAAALLDRLESGDARVQRWPGVQLSPATVKTLSDGLGQQVTTALRHAGLGAAPRLDRALNSLDEQYPVVRLLERLDTALVERSPGGTRTPSVLSEIALGPPPEGAWLADQRETLAVMCSLGEELTSATIRDDRPAQRELRKALNSVTARLLRVVEGR